MNRKTVQRTAVLALVLILTITMLAACGGGPLTKPRNGTYKSDDMMAQTWTFTGDNEITMSAIAGIVSSDGTYTIDGSKMTITSSLLGTESTSSYTITEITANSFFIDGTMFLKQ